MPTRYILCLLILSLGCNEKPPDARSRKVSHDSLDVQKGSPSPGNFSPEVTKPPVEPDPLSAIEEGVIRAGLVDVRTLDPTIYVDLKYAGSHNFLGKNMYGTFNKAYLQPEVAQRVVKAQHFLKQKFSYYSLIIYDAVRPYHIQKLMWDSLHLPGGVKHQYLSDPSEGSLHNYGVAVDAALVYEDGRELDMGTPFDFFGELAHTEWEERLVDEGKLTHRQLLNRELLRSVMKEAGLQPIGTEWWHFNACSRTTAAFRYQIID
ncbi:MAG: M15 family metallopeptidase [Bacteroidia bacterium]